VIDVKVSNDAELDICNGADYYDGREDGLGEYFEASILADLTSLEFLGGTHAIRFGLHSMPAKTFPYWIYYKMMSPEILVVVAVISQFRGDEYVLARLRGV
jgi:hypothetical protein